MKRKIIVFIGLAVLLALVLTNVALASRLNQPAPAGLVEVVRESNGPYQDLAAAEAAGHGLFHGCVSGPQEGAMGVHFARSDIVGDGVLEATEPEALLYEFTNGRMQLVGVEYVVLADDWHTADEGLPVLMGQLFNYVGRPNRYGMPAFYELHVWVWERNPLGTFADWNPLVSCVEYTSSSVARTYPLDVLPNGNNR